MWTKLLSDNSVIALVEYMLVTGTHVHSVVSEGAFSHTMGWSLGTRCISAL